MLRPWLALSTLVVAGCAALGGLTGGEEEEESGLPPEVPGCGTPEAPGCGAHGRCVDQGGAPTCACEAGYAGPTCRECAPGGQDRDGDGTCAPDCASTTCQAHARCDDASGTATCACVTGYALEGGACVWKGVVRDPGFVGEPADAWTLAGSAKLAPTAAGVRDPGVVNLQGASCLASRVSQPIAMPGFAEGEPLALELAATGSCTFDNPLGLDIPVPCTRPLSVAVGARGLYPFSSIFLVPAQTRVCLGERAFGGTFELAILPTSCSSRVKSLAVDHASIVPAPDCAAPGVVVNGDFEGNGGWTASGTGAEVAPGVGNASSRGGRLRHAKRCDGPRLSGQLSVPLAVPAHPALTFTVKGTSGRRMTVGLGGLHLASIGGTSVYEKVSLCLPEHARGMAPTLQLTADDDAPSGACGDPDDYEFVVDDLKIEEDAACLDGFVVDGGFEAQDARRHWTFFAGAGGSVSFFKSSTSAHTGMGYARVYQGQCDASTSLTGIATIPEPAQGGGPALEFWYRAPAATAVTFSGPDGTLAPAGDGTRAVQCLDPRRPGFPHVFSFGVSATSGCTPGSLSLDDLRVTRDPACPAQ